MACVMLYDSDEEVSEKALTEPRLAASFAMSSRSGSAGVATEEAREAGVVAVLAIVGGEAGHPPLSTSDTFSLDEAAECLELAVAFK